MNKAQNGRGRQWRWPIGPETVRSVLSSHSVLGLAFAAVIYLVCLTGTIAVFAPDLERWELPATPVAAQLSDTAAAHALTEAAKRVPADVTLYLSLPSPATEGTSLTAFSPSFERKWAVDEDGSLAPLDAAWTEFLLHLHINLHLPRSWGEFIVGLTGVALLSSLVSGILAHPRVIRDAFHLRLGGSRRLQEADLHNRLGIWALPFHFTLALTGALLGLSTIIVAGLSLLLYRGDISKVYALFLDAPPPIDARASPMPDIATLIAQARARGRGAEPRTIMVERPGRSDMRIAIHGGRPRLLVQQDEIRFDAVGRRLDEEHPEDLVAGTRMLNGIGQLHFGWFGGLPVRLAYGALGLALCIVTSTGVTIWLARRRDRGRAASQWERIWTAIIWGQPIILALTALLALLAVNIALPPLWIGLTICSIAGSICARSTSWDKLSHLCRFVLAGMAGALAVLHGSMALFAGRDAFSVIDGLLLTLMIGLSLGLVRRKTRRAG